MARKFDPLLQRKERRLVGIRGDADDDAVEYAGRAPHQVLVTIGDRIEGAGIDGDAFRIHFSAR